MTLPTLFQIRDGVYINPQNIISASYHENKWSLILTNQILHKVNTKYAAEFEKLIKVLTLEPETYTNVSN